MAQSNSLTQENEIIVAVDQCTADGLLNPDANDDNKTHQISDLVGWAEEVTSRW